MRAIVTGLLAVVLVAMPFVHMNGGAHIVHDAACTSSMHGEGKAHHHRGHDQGCDSHLVPLSPCALYCFGVPLPHVLEPPAPAGVEVRTAALLKPATGIPASGLERPPKLLPA